MGKLYHLSPSTFRAFGYTCIGLAIIVIVLFLVDTIKRNKRHIRKHLVEQASVAVEDAPVDSPITTEEALATATAKIGFRDAYFAALLQVVAFGLWNMVVHFSMFNYTEIPVWPFYMLLIGLIYACVAYIDYRYPITKADETSKQERPLILAGLIVGFFAFQFFLLSAQNCFNVAPLAVYDYYGPVRVVGYNNSHIGRDGKNNLLTLLRKYYFKCPVDEAVGQIQVTWGGDWACPHHGDDYQCFFSMHSFHCDHVVCENCYGGCTEEEYDKALNSSQYCVQNGTLAADFTVSWDFMSQGISYDPKMSPGDDPIQYATEIMYADCDACQAEFADIVEEQPGLTSSWVSIFFGLLAGLSAIMYFVLVIDIQGKKDNATPDGDTFAEPGVEID